MTDKALTASKMKKYAARIVVYLFAIAVAVTAFYPFFVMIISATHDNYNIVAKINVLPGNQLAVNYARLTQNIELYRGMPQSGQKKNRISFHRWRELPPAKSCRHAKLFPRQVHILPSVWAGPFQS